jgi:hypothetical protein
MRIKQWVIDRLFRDAIFHYEETLIHVSGKGWRVVLPPPPIVEKPKPFVPAYDKRTPEQHDAIRKAIQQNPKQCTHLKGGRLTAGSNDFNVSSFTFINGVTRIKCLSCRREWWPGDPDWDQAVKMTSQSTNSHMTSEIPSSRARHDKLTPTLESIMASEREQNKDVGARPQK